MRMNHPVSPLDFCIYLKRCEVQCSLFEDLSREIDLYQPDYYRYWARLKVQICSHTSSRVNGSRIGRDRSDSPDGIGKTEEDSRRLTNSRDAAGGR